MNRPAGRRNRLGTAVIAAAAAVPLLVPLIDSPFLGALALSCLMYIGLAVSWSIFSGPTRYLSLGTAAFFGLGAYVTAFGIESMPWPLLIATGGVVASVFALLVGLATLHLRGAYFAVLTFGLGELVKHGVTYVEKSVSGTVGRVLMVTPSDATVYWTVLILAALAIAAYAIVARSDLGVALRGVGADEERAATLGVSPRWIKIAAFCLTAWFAGAIGAAVVVRWTYVDPHSVFSPFVLFQTLMIAMVGGPARLRGPVIAAVVFSVLAEYLRLSLPYLYMILLGSLLIASVLFLPEGLAGVRWIDRLFAPGKRRPEGTRG